jgi:hypothetical protein
MKFLLARYPDQLHHFIVITPQQVKIRKTVVEEDLQ